MNSEKDFKIYLQATKDDTSLVKDVTEYTNVYIEEETILEISKMSKKQLDLYIFRHPEIIKIKNWSTRLISINILKHVLKNINRIKNKI